MYQDKPSVLDITIALIQRTKHIEPNIKSDTKLALVNDFKAVHREHFEYFLIELINQLRNIEDTLASSPEHIVERIHIFHFIRYEVLPSIPFSNHTLTLDGLVSNALRVNLELFLAQNQKDTPLFEHYQQLCNTLKSASNYDLSYIIDIIDPQTSMDNIEFDACTDLLQLGTSTPPGQITPESIAFLRKYSNYLQNPERCKDLLNQLFAKLSTLDNIENPVLTRLETYSLAVNTLHFTLSNLCQHESLREMRVRVLLLLNKKVNCVFIGALSIIKENKLVFGHILSVISRIKYAYKLLQDLQKEIDPIFISILTNKANESYNQTFISELKNRIIDYYDDRANLDLTMAQYADLFESRASARVYTQQTLNKLKQLKDLEKPLRALRSKTKAEVDSFFKTFMLQPIKFQKYYEKKNPVGDLLSAFYQVIKSQEADNLQAIIQFFENLKLNTNKPSDLSILANATVKKECIDLTNKTSQLPPPASLTQIHHWKNHFDNVFKLLQTLKQCTQQDEIIELVPEILKLLEAIVGKMKDDENSIVVKAAGEIIDKLRSHVSEMNTLFQRHATTVEEQNENNPEPNTKAQIILNEKPLHDAIEILFSAEFTPKVLNQRLNLLLSDQNMTQQIIEAVNKKINETLPSDESAVQIDADQINHRLNELNRPINLLIYFISHILPKHPSIVLPKNEAVGLLYRISCLYFKLGRLKFHSVTDYNKDDDVLFKTHQELYQILEKLLPDYNDYIYYLKSSEQKDKIWKTHLRVVQYQIDYAYICLEISDFNQAIEIVKVAQQSIIELNGAIEEIAEVTGVTKYALGQELVTKLGDDLAKADKKLQIANQIAKPNNVVYMIDGLIHCDNPEKRVKHLFDTLKDIQAEIDNPKYAGIADSFQKYWKSYPLRLRILACIHNHCDQLFAEAHNSYDKPPTEKLNTLENLHIGINALNFVIKKLTPYHDERFPNVEATLSLQRAITIFMVQQAQLSWQLLAENKLPFGKHALFYQRLLSHYKLFHQTIINDFKKSLANKLDSDPEYVSLQYQTLFEHAIFFGSIAEQFADFEWANSTHQHAKDALSLLGTAPISLVQLDRCKRSLAKANRPTASSYLTLKSQFIALSEKVENVEVFLEDFSQNHTFSLQKRNNISLPIDENRDDPLALGDLVLEMSNQFALPQIISDLTKIKNHLQSYTLHQTECHHGINNLFAETVDCFINHVDKAIFALNKQLKKLEVLDAKRQKEEILRIQQEIQREYKKSVIRTKIVEEEPSMIPTTTRKASKPVQRERQRKKEAPFTFESYEPTYEMVAELESQPIKQTKKAIRQQKKALKNQSHFVSDIVAITQTTPLVVDTLMPQPLPGIVPFNARQLKKVRRKQRDQVAQEQSDSLLISLIVEIASLTLQQEKLTSIDDTYRVPDISIKRVPHLQKLLDLFVEHNIKAYVYGGYPRDILLNKQHKDLDLVVFCSPETVRDIFGAALRRHETLPNQFSLQGDIDIRCTERSLLEFANGLDTTANALFVDANGHLYDPKGGYSNLFVSDQLETIGHTEQTFFEDPIRMYRLLRQSVDLNKSIQEKDLLALKQHADKLSQVNFSVFRKNFSSLFLNGKAEVQLDQLFKEKLLASILPQLNKANYSYAFVHYWLKMQYKRVDSNANRMNDYPFYRLVAIMLAPHCYNQSKASFLSTREVVHNVVVDFFANFANYKSKKEFNYLKKQLAFFFKIYQHDASVHLRRMREKQQKRPSAPIVHQYQASKNAITITIDETENSFSNTMHIAITRRTNGIT